MVEQFGSKKPENETSNNDAPIQPIILDRYSADLLNQTARATQLAQLALMEKAAKQARNED